MCSMAKVVPYEENCREMDCLHRLSLIQGAAKVFPPGMDSVSSVERPFREVSSVKHS